MALIRNLQFFPSIVSRQNFNAAEASASLQKKRDYAKAATKKQSTGDDAAGKGCAPKKRGKNESDPCDYKICNKKPKKKSLWRRLMGGDDPPPPPIECCRMRQKQICDPDLSEFGGKAYRTCGSAYIIQKDILPSEEHETTKEEAILRKMEAPLEQKSADGEDPLPKFKGAEMRMLELADNRLHPTYKQHYNLKKKHAQEVRKKLYKTVSWPIDMHEIPARFNINKATLEKKNMEYVEFKRIEPPRQLVERIVEMERNALPTLERKPSCQPPVNPVDFEEKKDVRPEPPHKTSDAVFDTLHQPETKF